MVLGGKKNSPARIGALRKFEASRLAPEGEKKFWF
jgi:hypothetical protein